MANVTPLMVVVPCATSSELATGTLHFEVTAGDELAPMYTPAPASFVPLKRL